MTNFAAGFRQFAVRLKTFNISESFNPKGNRHQTPDLQIAVLIEFR